jgi:glycosyltransferase involved in cell wall biosynthesis
MPVLSVIIPAYNEGRTIHLILDSVRNVELSGGVTKEIIVVNDCSKDSTEEAILDYCDAYPEFGLKYIKHEVNKGKGAAIHTGIKEASGDFLVIQDADLEYDPEEYNLLLAPMLKGTADVVYGSRFIGGKPHRILFFWHTIGNKFLTFLSNMFSNLNLTDMETCYKLFRTDLIKSIELKENRFGFEPEVTQKIARIKGLRIYEVGISYYGRTYEEGKKINWTDGFRALYCIAKYGVNSTKKEPTAEKLLKPSRISRKNGIWLTLLLALLFFSTGLHNADKHYHTSGFANVFTSDGLGYYQYLPAQFINHSVVNSQRWCLQLDNGKILNKFTCGVAYMQAPFFFLSNAWCNLTGHPTNGYAAVNGFFIVLGAMIYCFLALLLIIRMLLPRFGILIAMLSVFLIFYGTNLIYYTLADSAMSHVYTFFLITIFIVRTPSFYSKPSIMNLLWLAFPLAIAMLIRQTNLIVVKYLLLYKVKSWKEMLLRIRFWLAEWHLVLIIIAVIFIVFIPQFIYWHLVTGKWYIYAYGYNKLADEAFIYWNQPKFMEVLAGPVSGWLTYTPVLIASLIGMVTMFRKKIVDAIGIIFVFIAALYIISSWWCYTFDCGYGHRGFVDFYALFSIPLAFTLSEVFKLRSVLIKFTLVTSLVFLSYVNIRMSMMYNWDPCWNGPSWTWKNYTNVIHKASIGGDYRQNYHKINE